MLRTDDHKMAVKIEHAVSGGRHGYVPQGREASSQRATMHGALHVYTMYLGHPC